MSDPMEPLQKLMEAFAREIEPLGLHLHTFAVLPNPDGPPHTVQAMLVFDGAEVPALGPGEEDPLKDGNLSIDEKDAFDMLARDFARSSDEEKAAEAAERLRKMQADLESGRDILDLGDDDAD